MAARHRAETEPTTAEPGRLLGALAAAPLDRPTAQALADLTTGWLRQARRGLDGALLGCVRTQRPPGAHAVRDPDPGARSGLCVTMAGDRS